ncbi:MAG: O-antigen ligase family protein [Sphaerobacter sp.]|nr:O-antigen ligase family protein [Sphaerobacter sp.]
MLDRGMTIRSRPGLILGGAGACALAGVACAVLPPAFILLAGALVVPTVLVLSGAARSFVLSVMVLSGGASLLITVRLGPVSLLGVITALVAGLAWALWVLRGEWGGPALRPAVPLALLPAWGALGTLAGNGPTMPGMQLLLVIAAFAGLILLTAATVQRSPAFADAVARSLAWAAWLATGCAVLGLVFLRSAADFGIGPRGYAAFALLPLAWYLVGWRHGSRATLLAAAVILALIAISLSRTALVVAAFLVALAQFSPSTPRGWIRLAALGLVVAVALYAAVVHIEPLRARFFDGDVSLSVGGLRINAMGRTKVWAATLAAARQSPWIGYGAGSASALADRVIPGLGHPHNDYLRLFHDFGVVGLGLWLLGYALLLRGAWRAWRRAERAGDATARMHQTAVLALVAVALGMVTDNLLVYAFIMAPLAIVVGTSLGLAGHTPSPVTAPSAAAPPGRTRRCAS